MIRNTAFATTAPRNRVTTLLAAAVLPFAVLDSTEAFLTPLPIRPTPAGRSQLSPPPTAAAAAGAAAAQGRRGGHAISLLAAAGGRGGRIGGGHRGRKEEGRALQRCREGFTRLRYAFEFDPDLDMDDLKPYIEKLIGGQDLEREEAEDAMSQIMAEEGAKPEQVAALLCLLRAKDETSEELAGFVDGMKKAVVPVSLKEKALDIVGTGGDGAHTINVSTAAVILAAAAGASVCKFGNRSVSSMCGSADVLEALGISVDLTPEQVAWCCEQSNIAFMFAPNHYPAMKNVAPIRRALGVRTLFNILGPMTNPAGAQHVVIGVFQEDLMTKMAGALKEVGYIEHGVIVHGCGGLDEISPLGPSKVIEIKNTAEPGAPKEYETTEYEVDPEQYGIPLCTIEDLKGGDRDTNARLLRETLMGGDESNGKRDAVVLNAGMGLYVYGLCDTIEAGFKLARETLNKGLAINQLDLWIAASKEIDAVNVDYKEATATKLKVEAQNDRAEKIRQILASMPPPPHPTDQQMAFSLGGETRPGMDVDDEDDDDDDGPNFSEMRANVPAPPYYINDRMQYVRVYEDGTEEVEEDDEAQAIAAAGGEGEGYDEEEDDEEGGGRVKAAMRVTNSNRKFFINEELEYQAFADPEDRANAQQLPGDAAAAAGGGGGGGAAVAVAEATEEYLDDDLFKPTDS